MNIFMDIFVFFLPLAMILKLQMPLSQKVGTVSILATRLMVCAGTIVNMGMTIKIVRQRSTEDPF